MSIADRLLALWVYASLAAGAFAGLGTVAEGGGTIEKIEWFRRVGYMVATWVQAALSAG